MGEVGKTVRRVVQGVLFQCSFNSSIKVEARAERISSDGGALIFRELDQRLRLVEDLAARLRDPRRPALVIYPLAELLRTRLFTLGQGWRDQDDADKLRYDPAFRLAVSERKGDKPLRQDESESNPNHLPSQPTCSRLIKSLSTEHNRKELQAELLNFTRKDVQITRGRRLGFAVVDVDSTPIEVHGNQGGSGYNGYYECSCYHPLLAYLAETEDWIGAKLRSGETWSPKGAKEFLLPLLDEVEKHIADQVAVRGDCAFAEGEDNMLALEERRNASGQSAPAPYVFRLKTNSRLEKIADRVIPRAIGKKPHAQEWAVEIEYRADTWSRPRRVILVIVDRPGEIWRDHFFLVTSWPKGEKDAEEVLKFYRPRGTMENHIGELKNVLCPALSCSEREPRSKKENRTATDQALADQQDSACNEATMLLHLLAYNLANFGRRLAEEAFPAPTQATTGHEAVEQVAAKDLSVPKKQTMSRSAKRTPSPSISLPEPSGWSLQRFREQILKVAVRFLLGSHEVIAIIPAPAAELWQKLWQRIAQLRPLVT